MIPERAELGMEPLPPLSLILGLCLSLLVPFVHRIHGSNSSLPSPILLSEGLIWGLLPASRPATCVMLNLQTLTVDLLCASVSGPYKLLDTGINKTEDVPVSKALTLGQLTEKLGRQRQME